MRSVSGERQEMDVSKRWLEKGAVAEGVRRLLG